MLVLTEILIRINITYVCSNIVHIANKFTAHFMDAFRNSQDDSLAKVSYDKCSAVAEMGDRLATIDMGRKLRRGICYFWGSWVPS